MRHGRTAHDSKGKGNALSCAGDGGEAQLNKKKKKQFSIRQWTGTNLKVYERCTGWVPVKEERANLRVAPPRRRIAAMRLAAARSCSARGREIRVNLAIMRRS